MNVVSVRQVMFNDLANQAFHSLYLFHVNHQACAWWLGESVLKDPRITVTASAELLAQLLFADTALKNSRIAPESKRSDALHALIVQVMSVRARTPAPPMTATEVRQSELSAALSDHAPENPKFGVAPPETDGPDSE